MSKKFSIVVPVYENQNGLKSFIAEINSIKNSITHDFEFIFVDDGNDYEITDCIKLENVDFKVIKNSINSGYGFSIKRGVEKSLGNLVGIIDCDSTYDLKDLIDKFIGFDLDKNDLLVGKRNFLFKDFFPRVKYRNLINFITSYLFKYKVEDLNSGIRIFKKNDFLENINFFPDQFSLTSTQTLITIASHKNLSYFSTNYKKRSGDSKINILIDPFKFIILILKVFLIFFPTKFFGYTGLVFIIISFFLLVYSFLFMSQILDLTILILFIAGINFIFFGLLAEILKFYKK